MVKLYCKYSNLKVLLKQCFHLQGTVHLHKTLMFFQNKKMLLNKQDEMIFNFNSNYYTCLIDLSKYSHSNIFIHQPNITMSFKTTELNKLQNLKQNYFT